MARKTLLTETEVRRFMKLAKMQPLGTNQLQEFAMEDEMAEVGDEGGEEFVDTAELEDATDLEVEDPEPAGMDVDITDEEADVLVNLGNKIEDVQGPPEEDMESLEVEEDPLEGGGEALEAEEDVVVPGARMPYQEGTKKRRIKEDSRERETAHYSEDEDADKSRYDDMLDKVKELEEHIHALKGDMDYDEEHIEEGNSQDAIVQEVARRVAARLAKENQQEEMVDHLAERIMARLVK